MYLLDYLRHLIIPVLKQCLLDWHLDFLKSEFLLLALYKNLIKVRSHSQIGRPSDAESAKNKVIDLPWTGKVKKKLTTHLPHESLATLY